MKSLLPIMNSSRAARILSVLLGYFAFICQTLSSNPVAYDIDRAIEICDSIALDNLEGIWTYPEDNVTVLVLRKASPSVPSLPEYEISVVETTDCNLIPGEYIGKICSTPDIRKFSVELFTERRGMDLLKPKGCTGTLSTDGSILTLNHNGSKLKLRLNLNPSILLPRLWRSMVRIGASSAKNSPIPVGMTKIYPSYDGNGSSRRKPRYL